MCERGERFERQVWPRGYWQGRTAGVQKMCRCEKCTNLPPSGKKEALQWMEFLRNLAPGEGEPMTKILEDVAPEEAAGEAEQPNPGFSDGEESQTSETGAANLDQHECPTHKRVVPWSEHDCASCNPAEGL